LADVAFQRFKPFSNKLNLTLYSGNYSSYSLSKVLFKRDEMDDMWT